MKQKRPQKIKTPMRDMRRFIILPIFISLLLVVGIGIFVIKTSSVVITKVLEVPTTETTREVDARPAQFPVGVNASRKEIVENTFVDTYFEEHVSSKTGISNSHTSWLGRAVAKIALAGWYQNLASASSRILVILSGERKEEIAEHFGKILGWDKSMKQDFLQRISSSTPEIYDGKFFPGTYVVARGATPEEVAPLIAKRFDDEILARYGSEVEAMVPLEDALTIASLLEREAYDFTDMRQIAGVIWNRLFIDMNLQLDATLQYAKGSKVSEPWWPRVRPADKYIDSPFNTYKNEGLPPSPIANPSLDAVLAALNPTKTDCMYYFHDKNGNFHCTATYEEHVALLKEYYGRGK